MKLSIAFEKHKNNEKLTGRQLGQNKPAYQQNQQREQPIQQKSAQAMANQRFNKLI